MGRQLQLNTVQLNKVGKMYGKNNGKATTILLVDDRPENLMAMEAVLEPLGYEIAKANSGLEALKYLLGHDVALIILDVRMPGMDGFETARFIQQRERTRYVPIVFVTANKVDEADLFSAHMAGAVDYISQPLRPNELSRKVGLIMRQMHRPAPAEVAYSAPPARRNGRSNSTIDRLGYDLGL